DLFMVERDRGTVADEVVGEPLVARDRTAQDPLEAAAVRADTEEQGMYRVGRPQQDAVRAGHRGAPACRPARRLREVLAERELREHGRLRLVGGRRFAGALDLIVEDFVLRRDGFVVWLFGFVRHRAVSSRLRRAERSEVQKLETAASRSL